MTAYESWTVGGTSVPHVRKMTNDQANRVITLSCSALYENTTPSDPRTEIDTFEAMACDVISNTQLINGGSVLQTCNGDPIIVSDGLDSWVGALEQPVINEGSKSDTRIDYDLVIHYETQGKGITYSIAGEGYGYTPETDIDAPDDDDIASKKYMFNFCGLDNITHYQYSNKTNPLNRLCYEIGYMVITEPRNVKTVKVIGSAHLTPAWLEVNGQRQNWIYSRYSGSDYSGGGTQKFGIETLTFNLNTPAKVLTFQTSNHIGGSPPVAGNNLGSYLLSVEVVYE